MELPIIGMSPGNGYFKEPVIKELLQKVIERYGKTAILIADVPAVSTYMALGYPENRARRDKAIPQGNALKNKVSKLESELGLQGKIKIVDWANEIENDTIYQDYYQKIKTLSEENENFRVAVNDATRKVLEYSEKKIENILTAVDIASHYLLAELAFMEFAPTFFEVPSVTYIYHKDWPVYESYIKGEFDGAVRSSLGFEIVTTKP